ncbi:twitch domain-containing radical SAM protein [Flavitalea sp. BT771]|uniref:twitch domain-containing radical SAM protein n=1 Tax=Flavitalea sp. BT771 TaxID=3063329 RepID=UPI0026E3A34C|nr:twitch domain-containing radical SAM protein [Flavitalea sp. BT771]MDO6435739.1 twitch domain-containing radical SAM protein [Flavitalea sp. BT771]MDV6224640.1 twitch domain-containing radical SAM protein [Flavitalea sp. BT771]
MNVKNLNSNDAFCILPWVQLHIATNGDINACCVSSKAFGNVKTNRLADVWYGEEMNEFRDKMLKNIKDERCAYCHSIEASGGRSLKQNMNRYYTGHYLSISPGDTGGERLKVNPPTKIDIRFSNVCNFRCRSCYHGASSRWFEEAVKLGETVGDKAIIRAIDSLEEFYAELEGFVDHVDEIYFAGGEPLIMDEHYKILRILENKRHFHVLLRYNTNFSTYKYREHNVYEMWSKFKIVFVAASLDGSGERGEFLRKEQKWEDVLANRELMRKICPYVCFSVSVTVSAFNIFHVPDFHKELVSLSFVAIELFYVENILQTPDCYSCQILPLEFKMKIKEKFEEHIEWISSYMRTDPKKKHSELLISQYIQQFKNCITYLFAVDRSDLIPVFVSRTNKIDEMREERASEVFPELEFMFKNVE